MKKRIAAILLVFIMLLGLLPAAALADEPDVEGEEPEAVLCTTDADCPAEAHEPECPKYLAPEEAPEEPEEPVVPQEPETPTDAGENVSEAVRAFLDAVDALEETQASVSACGSAYDALTEEEQAREDVAEAYMAFIAVVKKLYTPAPLAASAIYVSKDGNDSHDGATEDTAVATLAKAVELAENGATIYVMSDLTMTDSARYWDKHLTITSGDGGPYTVTRGDSFTRVQDPARGGYCPAMIEVGGTDIGAQTASLRLENIILDDNRTAAGTYFLQASTDSSGQTSFTAPAQVYNNVSYSFAVTYQNSSLVQDAMIATYNGTSEITLGSGAVLQNFGGMSAVRLSGGDLLMEAGSKICDTSNIAREKAPLITAIGTSKSGATHEFDKVEQDYGPAGAVWIQGGHFTMEAGAEISNMSGRAVYVDSGSTEINGVIENITPEADMWQGASGVALHLRGGASGTMGATGKLLNCENTSTSGADAQAAKAIVTYSSDFEMLAGAEISGLKNINVIYADDLNGNYAHKMLLNGSIHDCTTTWSIMCSWYALITIGPDCVIQKNSASGAGGLMYTSNGSRYLIQGKVIENTASNGMFYLANQGGGSVSATMEEGAMISNNTGKAVRVNNGSTFSMNGGEISGNTDYGVHVTAKSTYQNAAFIMNGGEISDNTSYGVYHEYHLTNTGDSKSRVELNGGKVFGNGTTAQIYEKVTPLLSWNQNSYARETGNYLKAASDVLQDNTTVDTTFGQVTLDADYDTIYLGWAAPAAANKIKELVGSEAKVYSTYALWLRPTVDETLHFTVNRPSTIEDGFTVYAAYIPLKADGTPADGAEVTLVQLKNAATLDVTLPDLSADQPYALMLVQENLPTITPADLIVYKGGSHGYDGVVNENGEIVTNNTTLPTPGFRITLPTTLKDKEPTDIILKEETTGKTWTIEPYGEPNDDGTYTGGVYRIVAGQGQDPVRVTFTGEDGMVHINDTFTVENALHQEYTMAVYAGQFNQSNVVLYFKGDPATTYSVAAGIGSLYIRNVVDNDAVTPVQDQAPTAKLDNAVAVIPENTEITYTINGKDVILGADAEPSLLFDGVLNTSEEPFEKRTEEVLTSPADGNKHEYEIKYLDLVDANNANTWIVPSGELDIYWPYPAGTSQSTNFKLLRFAGIDRDLNSDEVADAIAQCDVKEIPVTTTAAGIRFSTKDFGPFALVWETSSGGTTPTTPSRPGTSSSSGSSGTKLNTEDHYSYIVGYKDGTLQPYGTITRGEVATIFFRLLTDETRNTYWSQTNGYSDCSSDLWCNNAISTLSNMGIIDGFADGTFRPYAKITRAQFAKIAVGFFETTTEMYKGYYTDVSEDAWYAEYVEAASRVGLIQGFEDGTFRPDTNITRAQACVIVNRALGRKPDADHLLARKDMITWPDNNPGDWYYADMQEATNSHDYTWLSKGSDKQYMENWTKKLEQRDWAAFEHAWSTAHSAPGGEAAK